MPTSLTRGLRVIEILSTESRPLGVTEIAERAGSSKSGAHSLLTALVRAGYAEHERGGVYRLGLKAWEIGRAFPVSRLLQTATPAMAALVAKIGEGAILGVLDGADVVYVHLADGEQAVRVHARVGDRIPAHCTSTGLALLAQRADAQVDSLLPAKLASFTPRTLIDRRAVRVELRGVRMRGYAVNRGGWRLDVGGIAAAIPTKDAPFALDAGVCIAVPLYRMNRAWVTEKAPLLVQCARHIGEMLAHESTNVAA
ncbi:MAG TPA: IclR family transcriptional regulator [Casimicrobiaceae bacterium]|nr:IclR family transcriptional regulator [Casimicrobiaceae bacterium]